MCVHTYVRMYVPMHICSLHVFFIMLFVWVFNDESPLVIPDPISTSDPETTTTTETATSVATGTYTSTNKCGVFTYVYEYLKSKHVGVHVYVRTYNSPIICTLNHEVCLYMSIP